MMKKVDLLLKNMGAEPERERERVITASNLYIEI
jgi:hypothetical protein